MEQQFKTLELKSLDFENKAKQSELNLNSEIDGFVPETMEVLELVYLWKQATGNAPVTSHVNGVSKPVAVKHAEAVTVLKRAATGDRVQISTAAGITGWIHYGFIKDFKKEYIENNQILKNAKI